MVALFLDGLKDSHTYFLPPARMQHIDTGYGLEILGDDCFVTRIRPKTDAELKLHVGDQVLEMNGFKVNRQDFHTMAYYLWFLAPQKSYELLLRSPSGDAMIWKVPQLLLNSDEIEKAIGKARKHTALILDLRGNPGGNFDSLTLMVGSLFDRDIKIADRVGRNAPKALIAKHAAHPCEGKLIVLVDGDSASAAELLEHMDVDSIFGYGIAVTDANLIMSDGKSLEKTGVVPDEELLPTGADLAAGRDPVLSRAAESVGVKLDPVEAGKMFPFEWKPI